MTDLAALMVTVQVSPNRPETVLHPLQPLRKTEPSAGVAFRMTVVPLM